MKLPKPRHVSMGAASDVHGHGSSSASNAEGHTEPSLLPEIHQDQAQHLELQPQGLEVFAKQMAGFKLGRRADGSGSRKQKATMQDGISLLSPAQQARLAALQAVPGSDNDVERQTLEVLAQRLAASKSGMIERGPWLCTDIMTVLALKTPHVSSNISEQFVLAGCLVLPCHSVTRI